MSKHLIQRVDRRARNADRFQQRYPVMRRLLGQMDIEKRDELITIMKPVGVRGKTGIGGQFRKSRRRSKFSELLVVADREHE